MKKFTVVREVTYVTEVTCKDEAQAEMLADEKIDKQDAHELHRTTLTIQEIKL